MDSLLPTYCVAAAPAALDIIGIIFSSILEKESKEPTAKTASPAPIVSMGLTSNAGALLILRL